MATRMHDIFGPGSNFEGRVFKDYSKIAEIVKACKELNLKIVLTSGTFDLLHVGHSRYLEKAKQQGDVLVVGIDSDAKVKQRKEPHRPMVPEDERMEILCHLRHVDIVFLKNADDPHWHLIKTVNPDVLITSEGEYNGEDLASLRELCGNLIVLERQATTSTTAKIRDMLIGPVEDVKKKLLDVMEFLDNIIAR